MDTKPAKSDYFKLVAAIALFAVMLAVGGVWENFMERDYDAAGVFICAGAMLAAAIYLTIKNVHLLKKAIIGIGSVHLGIIAYIFLNDVAGIYDSDVISDSFFISTG